MHTIATARWGRAVSGSSKDDDHLMPRLTLVAMFLHQNRNYNGRWLADIGRNEDDANLATDADKIDARAATKLAPL
jgi:hypothetical protein